MRIKSVSEGHKGEHNVILDFDFRDILSKKLTEPHFVRACVREMLSPDFLNDIDDIFEKRIVYGIWLTKETPYNVYIFTSPEKKADYEKIFTMPKDANDKNPYIEKVSFVKIKSGDDALEIIDDFYKQFAYQREVSR